MSKRWLTYRTSRDKYSLSESTQRRLIKAGLWPEGEYVTRGRKVFAEEKCDEAFAKLLAKHRAAAA